MNRRVFRAKGNDEKRGSRASRSGQQQSGPAVKHADCRLQRLHGEYGNGTVQRLYESGALQAKLKIGRPGNRYEREADSVADRVMAMPEPEVGGQEEKEEEEVRAKPLAAGITPLMQREAEEEEEVQKQAEEEEESAQAKLLARQEQEEEDVQKQPEEKKEEEPVQAKEQTGKTPRPAPAVESGINAIRGRGRPLPESARAFFEPRFGADFSAVRVHTDPGAAHLARSVKARAFTLGRDLVFGSNQYAPETAGGKRLLAHELTHVVQQRGGRSALPRPALIRRSICPGSCVKPVKKGKLCKAKSVTRDSCAERNAAQGKNRISHIRVLLSKRQVHLFWNGKPKTAQGTKQKFSCTPNKGKTPRGWDKVGVKCGPKHTSWKKYNMAWFTAFRSSGYKYGFHDSQPLGSGRKSGGCVRVSCEVAKTINKNSKSNWTSIIVR